MRNIKFRGISIETGEMVYGGGIDTQRDTPVIINQGTRHFVDVKTIGQFTECRDCDDVDIYEGDIVDVDGYISAVRFYGGALCVDTCGYDFDYTAIGWTEGAISVIGNIHQNPELLK